MLPKVCAHQVSSIIPILPTNQLHRPNKWSDDKEKKLQALLGTTFVPTKDSEDGSVSRSMELGHCYWSNLIQLVKPGLYAPGAERSFSADFYAIFAHPSDAKQLWLLAIQFKSGEKVYTREMVKEEVYKCFDLNLLAQTKPTDPQKHVAGVMLVFVGGCYQDVPLQALNSHASCIDIEKLVQKPAEQPKADAAPNNKPKRSKKANLKITEEAKPKEKPEYIIPTNANLQVAILNDLGKKHFLSTFNTVVTTNVNTTV